MQHIYHLTNILKSKTNNNTTRTLVETTNNPAENKERTTFTYIYIYIGKETKFIEIIQE
jgi:hypothetical protein